MCVCVCVCVCIKRYNMDKEYRDECFGWNRADLHISRTKKAPSDNCHRA